MEIKKNYNLTALNTFGIKTQADFFCEIESEKDLAELLKLPEFKNNKKLFLGGGSNILFTENFKGIVILNKIKGIEIIKENEKEILIKVMGGENWNDLVNFVVGRGYWGIENLALIPGSVGASPVQNIGAYGVELKDVLEKVEAFDLQSSEKRIFSNSECEFGYRESVFKNKLKGKYFISAIILKLQKNKDQKLEYKILKDYVEKNNLKIESPKDVSQIVSEIRRSKLPDPKILGNAGSFFKNVFVTENKLEELRKLYPEIPSFQEGEIIKIPAGWLIEQCGPHQGGTSPRQGGTSWKGYREGRVGVHEKQALVLVNHGGATGEEIKNLAFQIIDSVYQKFGLKLTPEVNLIP
jgi:UDP-N-acetylmuramate dehydrogenase